MPRLAITRAASFIPAESIAAPAPWPSTSVAVYRSGESQSNSTMTRHYAPPAPDAATLLDSRQYPDVDSPCPEAPCDHARPPPRSHSRSDSRGRCSRAGRVLVAPLAAQAATLTVTSSADSGAGSLRDVIAASNPGDTIVFDPSVTSVALQTGIDLDWGVTIDGGDTVTITRTNTNNFQQFAFGPELPGQDPHHQEHHDRGNHQQ